MPERGGVAGEDELEKVVRPKLPLVRDGKAEIRTKLIFHPGTLLGMPADWRGPWLNPSVHLFRARDFCGALERDKKPVAAASEMRPK
jgi:hypothetical protein